MGGTVYTVEYFCDAGRREHHLYGVRVSPSSARDLVEYAIEDMCPGAIIKTTDLDQASLKKWMGDQTWNGRNHVWYLSTDGLFAMSNAWTQVQADEHEVPEDVAEEVVDSVSETMPCGPEPHAACVWDELEGEYARGDEEAFAEAVRHVEAQLGLVRTALLGRGALSVPVSDLSHWLGRMFLLAGRLDAMNGFMRI